MSESPTTVLYVVQLVVAIVTIIGAGGSTYLGLRLANTENRKDIEHLGQLVERLESEFREHTKPDNHVTKDQISEVRSSIADLRRSTDTANARIEAKLDRLAEHWPRN